MMIKTPAERLLRLVHVARRRMHLARPLLPRRTTVTFLVLATVVLLVVWMLNIQRSGILFEDDFDGDQLNEASWNTCHWWNDKGCTIATNDELEWYLPSQVDVQDGELRLTAERANTHGSDDREYPYRSGMVTTGPSTYEGSTKFAFTFGTVEARVRAPAGEGLWAALWLLPASRKSRPEIDILEVLGNDPAEAIMHLHPVERDQRSPNRRYSLPPGQNFANGWRDVRLDWEPNQLTWYIDGKLVWRFTGDQVPNEPMYLVANLAVGGVYPGPPPAETQFPATYAIDFVRVWRPVS